MIGWFVAWLERLVKLGLDLAGQLVAGILRGLLGQGATGDTARGSDTRSSAGVRRASAGEVVDVRHQVLRAGLPRSTAIFAGDDEPSARHWVAERRGRIVGVVTVLAAPMPGPPPPEATPVPAFQLRGMAVLPEHRGEHLGEELLLAAQAEVGSPMWCNARTGVVGFYAKHGWRPVGETFEVPHAGPHQRMWWPGPTTPARPS